eukprot:scaffold60327_cov60-Phaeocystis_antarctica.AAC.7
MAFCCWAGRLGPRRLARRAECPISDYEPLRGENNHPARKRCQSMDIAPAPLGARLTHLKACLTCSLVL